MIKFIVSGRAPLELGDAANDLLDGHLCVPFVRRVSFEIDKDDELVDLLVEKIRKYYRESGHVDLTISRIMEDVDDKSR